MDGIRDEPSRGGAFVARDWVLSRVVDNSAPAAPPGSERLPPNVMQERAGTIAALGFRVRSGQATAVVLGAVGGAPRLFHRREVALSDPAVPQSAQPHHAGFGTLQQNEPRIRRLAGIVARVTAESIAELLEFCRSEGWTIARAALVVGSQIDPAAIANPHIRAHALDGQIFRTALEKELRANGILVRSLLEREVYARAADARSRSEEDVRVLIAALGRPFEGPWRAEEKLAAAAAWMALATGRSPATPDRRPRGGRPPGVGGR